MEVKEELVSEDIIITTAGNEEGEEEVVDNDVDYILVVRTDDDCSSTTVEYVDSAAGECIIHPDDQLFETQEDVVIEDSRESDLDEEDGRNDSDNRPYHCNLCDYKAVRRDTLINHVSSVHEKHKPHVCDFCNFKTARRGTLVRHVRVVHGNPKAFICPLCGFRTDTQVKLGQHVKSEHAQESRPPQTPKSVQIVQKRHNKLQKLQQSGDVVKLEDLEHNLVTEQSWLLQEDGKLILLGSTHSNKAVICDLSTPLPKVNFQQQSPPPPPSQQPSRQPQQVLVLGEQPRQHLLQNPTRLEFPCNLCEYKAVNQYKLKAHVKIVHEKRKPFCCRTCDFRTVTINKLNNHVMEVHNRQKPFVCHLCDFKSARQYNLNVHVSQVHNQEKPFACRICDFSAARKDKVRRHLFVTHGRSGVDAAQLIHSRGMPIVAIQQGPSSFIELLPKTPAPPTRTVINGSIVLRPSSIVLPNFVPVETSPMVLLGQGLPVEMTVDVTSQEDELEDEEEGGQQSVYYIDATAADLVEDTKMSKAIVGKRRDIPFEEVESRKHSCDHCDYKAARSNTLKMHVIAVHEQSKNYECAHCSYKTARRGDLNRHLKTVHKSLC